MTSKLTLVLLMDTALEALTCACEIIKRFSQEDSEIDFISSPVVIWQGVGSGNILFESNLV
ncbi:MULTISPECIES: hypothetical protein [Nostoc]|uniref:GlxA family transcriptional regulator n=1 Tax=Nostoc paludosum FACHB-159 TaxID=2692908 RepID=A0ABR8K2R1_9NOSO|nr:MULTISPECIES: hypothetical protein [Nostoc]MBD2677664.1 hypothetical protein [Nostoc sp. FACHB-857]MBD2733712.1 hypothetical protein [Nostoc paludosum FACHB-159]